MGLGSFFAFSIEVSRGMRIVFRKYGGGVSGGLSVISCGSGVLEAWRLVGIWNGGL